MTVVTDLLLFVCDRDLEAVWTDSSSIRRDLLLKLSAEALAAFVKSAELRVVSEDTVLYTVVRYSKALSTARPHVSAAAVKQQRATLLGAVRFPQLTPSCLFFVTPELPWIDQQLCLLAGFMQNREMSSVSLRRMRGSTDWLSGQRSTSPKQQHTFQFTISLKDVQKACEELQTAARMWGRMLRTRCSNGHSFGGREWGLNVQAQRAQEGIFLGLWILPQFPGTTASIPWTCAGVVFTWGPHVRHKPLVQCGTGKTYAKTGRNLSRVIGSLADAAD